ncbi:ROBO2 [Lepeophtheirus salmonis]|uniref:ROBO2 n=1 Tax=Lepeophtheirus salmonis TaxID=72036 RepID=A0A7R8D615_LEPSM|nr:ROBO2 [Lepeophtheirus salmonis]CAF3041021.1 ROBO2 [Lepeophtheirus salmonis]
MKVKERKSSPLLCHSYILYYILLIDRIFANEIISISSSASSPIILEHPPEKVIVAAKDPVTLNCKAEGVPPPVIHCPGRTAGSEDEGVYWCSASNEHGTAVSRNSTLTIAYIDNDFRVVPRNMEGILDSTISMNCIPPAGLPTPVVRWKKNDEYLDLSSSHRILILASGTLKINPLEEDDAGQYQCSASNLAGTKETNPVHLKVLRPPSFVQSPRNMTVISGNDIILECVGDGDPSPKIIWTKGERSDIDTNYEQTIPGQGLKLRNIHPAQEGMYKCTATSPIGSTSASAYVRVIEPPLITVHSPRTVTAPALGSKIELDCSAEGRPEPVLLWMREDDRTILLPGDRTDTLEVSAEGTLIVKATQDTTHYICLVVNNAGAAVARTTVHLRSSFMENDFIVVRGVKVDVLKIKGLSSTSIKVTWRLSNDATSDLVDGFYILYRCRRGSPAGFTSITVLHAGATSYVVNRLEPYTPYEFLVVPFQRGFSGHPSSLYIAWTLESIPNIQPKDLKWTPINGSSVNITWLPLEIKNLRGQLRGYQLMILQNGQIASNQSLEQSQNWVMMSNLEPFHTYEIKVAAYNSKGLGPFSESILVKPEPSSMFKGAAVSDSTSSSSSSPIWLLGFFISSERGKKSKSKKGSSSSSKERSLEKKRHSSKLTDGSSSSESDSDYAYIDRSTHSITGRFIETDPAELPLSPYATTEVDNRRIFKKVAQRGTQTRRRRHRHTRPAFNSEDCLQPLSVHSLIEDGDIIHIGDSITDPELSDHIYTLVASRGASAAASLGSLHESMSAGKRKRHVLEGGSKTCINLLDIIPPPPSYPPPPSVAAQGEEEEALLVGSIILNDEIWATHHASSDNQNLFQEDQL